MRTPVRINADAAPASGSIGWEEYFRRGVRVGSVGGRVSAREEVDVAHRVPGARIDTVRVLCGALVAVVVSAQAVGAQSSARVWARGRNSLGQAGHNSTTDRHAGVQVHGPANVGFLQDVVALAGGHDHSLALKADGTVWAWGRNDRGQLGDSSTTDRLTPVQVRAVSNAGVLINVVAIGAGDSHSLAGRAGGDVVAWGWNRYGQLGDGTTTDRHRVVLTSGHLPSITAVGAGRSHSLASAG
jgi:alpha-tubulin suppressor-like RCC1 family protein